MWKMNLYETSREEQLLNSQFSIIQITGKLSSNVKDILYINERNERLDKISKVKDDLKSLVMEISKMSNSLNLDINEILEGVNKNDI